MRRRLEILAFMRRDSGKESRSTGRNRDIPTAIPFLPQYAKDETAPPLKNVAPRIQEILLQQKVNSLFSAWLENLRKQGDVEVLDPALQPVAASAGPSEGAR